MFTSGINVLAVGVSAIVALALGFVWFTIIFRAPYLEGLGKTAEELARGPSVIVASIFQLIGNLVMAYVLAWLMARTDMWSIGQALLIAVIAWFGLVASFLGPMYAYQAYSLQFFLINSGSVLLSLLIMGVILSVWQ